MTVRHLPPVGEPDPERNGPGGPDHPMRKVTVATAFDPASWTPERAANVAELFDGLAAEWNQRFSEERQGVIVDALERGGPFPAGPCVELGSGTGLVSAEIAARLGSVIAVDLAAEMLALAPAEVGPRVRADSHRLPMPDNSVAVLVLQNMLLFPTEVDRVLRSDGAIVWVNTSGPFTPIHLTADEVDRALPGEWSLVASGAGSGTWAVARRQTETTS